MMRLAGVLEVTFWEAFVGTAAGGGVIGEEWGRDDVRNPVISVLSGLCIQRRERRLDV